MIFGFIMICIWFSFISEYRDKTSRPFALNAFQNPNYARVIMERQAWDQMTQAERDQQIIQNLRNAYAQLKEKVKMQFIKGGLPQS